MRIVKIKSQHRRDFVAIYECESCGHKEEGSGYDDNNFHSNVVPRMKCKKCGQTSPDGFRPLATKYPEGEVV